MKTENTDVLNSILRNIRKIMNDSNLTQTTIAEYAETSPSQMSKILKGEIQLSLKQLSNIAKKLNLRIIDVITYPDKYVKTDKANSDVKAQITIELKEELKDEVLTLVFGNKNLEILNK